MSLPANWSRLLFEKVLPVLDAEHGKMIGVVTVDDLLEELLPQGWRREFGMTAVEE